MTYNIANKIKSNIGSATLYNTHVSLENMGIIKKVQKGEYEIVDIFLEILLQQTQDAMVSLDGKLDIQLEDKK